MDGGEGEEGEGEISLMCESIGHRPLRGRCPKGYFIDDGCQLPWKCISMNSHQIINILKKFLREYCSKSNMLQLSHNMFCKNIAHLAVAREQLRAVTHSYAP